MQKTNREHYYKIPVDDLDELTERLNENIGRCDHMAGKCEDIGTSEENPEKAYEKLREEIDIFLNRLREDTDLHFE
jgi:hypothetical protein